MAHKDGVVTSERAANWLAVVVGICALLGPPVSFFMAVTVANARSDQRITTLEQNDASTRSVLAQVRDDVAFIRGKLEREGK